MVVGVGDNGRQYLCVENEAKTTTTMMKDSRVVVGDTSDVTRRGGGLLAQVLAAAV